MNVPCPDDADISRSEPADSADSRRARGELKLRRSCSCLQRLHAPLLAMPRVGGQIPVLPLGLAPHLLDRKILSTLMESAASTGVRREPFAEEAKSQMTLGATLCERNVCVEGAEALARAAERH